MPGSRFSLISSLWGAAALCALLTSTSCGGSVDQSAACHEYVACVGALDAARDQTTNVDRYAAGGACWGSEEGATLCDRSCAKGLAWMRERINDLPQECQP